MYTEENKMKFLVCGKYNVMKAFYCCLEKKLIEILSLCYPTHLILSELEEGMKIVFIYLTFWQILTFYHRGKYDSLFSGILDQSDNF